MMQKVEELLSAVVSKLDELRIIENENNENINILGVLGKESDEVIMCKVLWAILNYKKDKKRIYLESFVKNVLNIELDADSIDNAMVYREFFIPTNNRRIDLVIKGPNIFIPIEAKINAGDQDDQCADYLKYAETFYTDYRDCRLYYLTKYGTPPSDSSLSGKDDLLARIKPISWDDILSWINVIIPLNEKTSDFVCQYGKALEMLLNKKKGDFDMSIDEMISTPDGIKAAIEIEKSLSKKKTELLLTIYDDIRGKIALETSLLWDPNLNDPWDYKKGIKEYYSRKSSTHPALTYNLGKIKSLEDGTEYYFILRFEVEDHSYVGYAIMRRNGKGELFTEDKPNDELISEVKKLLENSDMIKVNKDWWLYWEYTVSNSTDITDDEPDFREMNEAYFKLYDENAQKKFVNQAVDIIKKFANNVK